MSDVDARIAALSPAKRAVLELRARRAGDDAIRKQSGEREFPLAFAQEMLWLTELLLGGAVAYNSPEAARLTGALDVDALRGALGDLVQRHEPLRTRFASLDGVPSQSVAEPVPPVLREVDLRDLDGAEQDRALTDLLRDEAQRPFDLSGGLLLRATLARLAEADQVLLVVTHHLASDGWSKTILTRDLAELYKARSEGRPASLPELEIQYGDYAAWQRKIAAGAGIEAELGWWREHLDGAPQALELPADRPRPPRQTFRGARVVSTLPGELREALEQLALAEGVTPFMALLAAFATLLTRYTGQSDLLVGTPVAGRDRRELESLVGCFANTLVLRCDLSGEPSFRELLQRTRSSALAAYGHQGVPFEHLVAELSPQRDLGRSPIFQVLFAYQDVGARGLALPGVEEQPVDLDPGWSKFDLTLGIGREGTGLKAVFEYSTDLFDTPRIERMSGHFETLLAAALAEPDAPITRLPLLAPDERERLLEAGRGPALAYPAESALQELFERQATATPDTVAVRGRDGSLTYAQLEQRANQLAHYLRAQGAAEGTLVGLCLGRSPQLVVAVLAVLKAGAAYVPLDPAYPAERLALMVEDAGARVLVTEEGLTASLPLQGARSVLVDRDASVIAESPTTAPRADVSADSAAYVLYTSGSTGKPKGVVLSHRGAVNLATWARETFSADELREVLFSTSLSWDLSVFEMVAALTTGGTLVLARDALELPDLGGVTLVNTVPSAITELLDSGAVPESVRVINLAGEPLSGRLARRIHAETGVARLLNLYGPTEVTTYSTAAEVPRDVKTPTIGRPLANITGYVLDGGGQQLPVGIPGELYLGGAGVALGYHDRPELTAERFVSSPIGNDERLYRTGDIVRWREDGDLDFVGRVDQQVKLRGFRIELGEVEATLEEHAAVREAAAIVREDRPGDKRLVAYVVAERASEAPSPQELQASLRRKLPPHMVPSAVVALDALPLTQNGKLDRRALPNPGQRAADVSRVITAARTPIEESMLEVWRQVLGVARLGIHDDFFAVGGYSLLAVRLVSRIRDSFGAEIPLTLVYEGPTVAELAGAVAEALASGVGDAEFAELLAEIEG